MNCTKKILNIALKVATWILVAFTVFMMIFTIVSVTTLDRNDRSIFGVKFYIVQTDSMSLSENNKDMEVHFSAGDIVMIKNLDDAKKRQLQPGDIIAFLSTNSESYGETVTHMVREVRTTKDGNLLGYVTYGTNTGTNDEAIVEPEYILGQYSGKLTGVGNFFAFIKTTPGYIVCILVPFLLLILYNGINVIRLFRRYKREQTEAMQAEREKLDAERAETQRMMEELMALKAQLDQKNAASASTAETAPEQEAEAKPTEDGSAQETTDEA